MELHPAGDLGDWDGMTRWCLEQIPLRPETAGDLPLRQWVKAAAQVI